MWRRDGPSTHQESRGSSLWVSRRSRVDGSPALSSLRVTTGVSALVGSPVPKRSPRSHHSILILFLKRCRPRHRGNPTTTVVGRVVTGLPPLVCLLSLPTVSCPRLWGDGIQSHRGGFCWGLQSKTRPVNRT